MLFPGTGPPTTDETRRIIGLRTCIILLLFASLVFVERCHTFTQAPDRDIAGYAVIGHEMLRGRLLYTDLWERKPPLLYATFAAAECVAGYGPREIFLLNVLAAEATLLCVYFIGSIGGFGLSGGVFAGVFWILLGGDLFANANQPNGELFVNVFLSAGFCVLVRRPNRPGLRIGFALLLGILFTAATLYKHHAIAVACALLVAYVVVPRPGSRWRVGFIEAALALAVIALSWSVLIACFAVRGRLDDLLDALVRQNSSYAGNSLSANLLSGLSPANLLVAPMTWAIAPLLLMALAALLALARRGRDGHWRQAKPAASLWGFWILSAWVMIAIPGTYLPHYYQLLMPPICVASGWAAASMLRRDATPDRALSAALRIIALGVALVATGWVQLRQYRLPAQQWVKLGFPDTHYFDNNFTFQKSVAEQLAKLLEPSETFWNFGEDNTLYFVARRSPPSGLLYLDPLVTGNETDRYWNRLLADLNRTPPDLIVVSMRTFQAAPPNAPVFPWMRSNYVPAPMGSLGEPVYRMFVRRGSQLYFRLLAASHRS